MCPRLKGLGVKFQLGSQRRVKGQPILLLTKRKKGAKLLLESRPLFEYEIPRDSKRRKTRVVQDLLQEGLPSFQEGFTQQRLSLTSKHSFQVTAFWLDYEGPNESESLAKPYRGEREESEREGTGPVLVIGIFYTKRRRSSCYVATFNDCLL